MQIFKQQVLNSYINLYNQMKKILHYPRLDTVLMVEKFIHDHSGEFKKKALWQKLPKKTMYQTYCLIIDYLIETRRIAKDKNGTIGWIWDPKEAKKYLKREDLSWKSNQK